MRILLRTSGASGAFRRLTDRPAASGPRPASAVPHRTAAAIAVHPQPTADRPTQRAVSSAPGARGAFQQQHRMLLQLLSSAVPATGSSSAVDGSSASLTFAEQCCRELTALLQPPGQGAMQPKSAVQTAQLLRALHKHLPAREFDRVYRPLLDALLDYLLQQGLARLRVRQLSILLHHTVSLLPRGNSEGRGTQLLDLALARFAQLGEQAWLARNVTPATVSSTLWAYAAGGHYIDSRCLQPLAAGVCAAVQAGVMDVKHHASSQQWSSTLLSAAKLQLGVPQLQPVWAKGVSALTQAMLQAPQQQQHEAHQQDSEAARPLPAPGNRRSLSPAATPSGVGPQDISSTLWACATASYEGEGIPQLVSAVVHAVAAGTMEAAHPQHWAHLFWGLAQLQGGQLSPADHAVLTKALSNAVHAGRLRNATASHWATLLWGLSRMGLPCHDVQPAWDAAIPVLDAAMRAGPRRCSAASVSMALVAAARSRHAPVYRTWLMAAAAGVAAHGLLDDADAGQAAWVLWALAEEWPATCDASAEQREAAEALSSTCTLLLTGHVEEHGVAQGAGEHLPRAVAALSSMDVMPPVLLSQECA